MATYAQRWAMICEGLLGQPATVAQQTRLADAIGATNAGPMSATPYSAMTNAQKAEMCVKFARRFFIDMVKNGDRTAALAQANTASANVDAEFPEV